MERRTILVVEDEVLIGTVIEDALTEAGFTVELLVSGDDAIALCEAGALDVDAVVTDIRLGSNASGWDVARRARECQPSIGIVYVSGDSGAEWHARGVPGSLFIQKPFAPTQILAGLTTLLRQARL